MTWTPISGSVPQYQAADGTLASGYYLKFYSAGTTSPFSMATDSTGVTTLAKAQINTAGYPVNGSSDVFIPHVSQSYKIVLYKNATDADNDTTANADWVIDNISQSAAATPTQVVNIEHQLGSEASGQVFTLASFTYSLGTNNLLVYRNGQLLRQGVSFDYSETTSSTITVNSSITIGAGDTWAFVKGTSTTSTISDAASVTYTPSGVGAVTTNVKTELDAIGSIISESSGIVTVDATSEIRLKTASTDRATVDSSGDVLIGTTSAFSGAQLTTTGNFGIENKGLIRSSTNGVLQVSADPLNAYASSALIFDVDGAEKVRIDNSGNVGVGASSPSAKLHVNGDVLFYDNNGSTAIYDFTADHYCQVNLTSDNDAGSGGPYTNSLVSNGANGNFEIRNNGNINFVMDYTSGNVGIGTTSPSKLLHLSSTAPIIRLEDNATGYFAEVSADNASGSLALSADVGNASGSSAILFNVDGTEKARITSTGLVGIGTSSPVAKLDINGNVYIRGTDTGLVISSPASNIMQITTNSVNDVLAFGSGNSVEAMRIDSSGNVLVGGTTAGTSSAGNLHLFNGTAPTGSVTDGIILYSEDVTASAELKVRDEAGNITTLSPHNFSLIPDGPSEEMAWAYYSEKDGKRINVDMLKLARMVEKLTGEKLVYED